MRERRGREFKISEEPSGKSGEFQVSGTSGKNQRDATKTTVADKSPKFSIGPGNKPDGEYEDPDVRQSIINRAEADHAQSLHANRADEEAAPSSPRTAADNAKELAG